jgi:hypothetical protein
VNIAESNGRKRLLVFTVERGRGIGDELTAVGLYRTLNCGGSPLCSAGLFKSLPLGGHPFGFIFASLVTQVAVEDVYSGQRATRGSAIVVDCRGGLRPIH